MLISVIGWLIVIAVSLFFFGFCIFIHEYGHLLAAMWRGLHVEKFSIGFGHAIYKWRWKNIDYQLGWIPFGGFVALPQLEPTDEPKTSDGKTLPVAKPIDRVIVAFAGPFFNVLSGFALAAIVWYVGVMGFPKADHVIVGDIEESYVDKAGATQPTPEFAAGLRLGDHIVGINGQKVRKGWPDVTNGVVFAKDGLVSLEIERAGKRIALPPYKAAPNPDVDGVGYPYFYPDLPVSVGQVMGGSPASRAGLKRGDQLLAVNGSSVLSTNSFIELVQNNGAAPFTLKVRRSGEERTIANLQPERQVAADGTERFRIGIALDNRVIVHPSPWEQFTSVLNMTGRTVRSISDRGNLIGAKNMSGPIYIVYALLQSFQDGFATGVRLVVLISFSLAIVNLLPVPVLDGGHILFGLVEATTRRRLPNRVAVPITYAFAILIIGFALYVTFFDVLRVKRQVAPPPRPEPAAVAPAVPAEKPALPVAPADSPVAPAAVVPGQASPPAAP